MKIYVLSSLLLACSVTGETVDLGFQKSIDANDLSALANGIEAPVNNVINELFWFNNYGTNLLMRDDSDKPVPLNIVYPSNESLADTQKELPNRVFFYLYTRDTQNNPELLHVNDPNTLRQSHFDPKKPTVLVTHGWSTSRLSSSCTMVRDAYLQHGDYNVIVVDWSKISKGSYLTAVMRVQMVGKFVASMINFLEGEGMNVSRATLVGHSLGAHVVGLAGYNAKSKVNYVVGLDPAYPMFTVAGPSRRLSTESGKYVMALHTNGGFNGFFTNLAHWDIYANDGTSQPGCGTDVSCSHGRAYEYFAESINSAVGFWALKCNSRIQFMSGLCNSRPLVRLAGAELNVDVKGAYYFKTSSSSPFALGRNN